jgi:hypothetical protein
MHRSIASVIFKIILKVMLYEGVRHSLRICLDHLNYDKMAAFQSYLQSGKQRKVEWVGMTVV